MRRTGPKTGLLGGSFNPAHRGHRRISLAAIDGPGAAAALQDALGFAIDAEGLIYLSEYSDYGGDHRLRRVWVKP